MILTVEQQIQMSIGALVIQNVSLLVEVAQLKAQIAEKADDALAQDTEPDHRDAAEN